MFNDCSPQPFPSPRYFSVVEYTDSLIETIDQGNNDIYQRINEAAKLRAHLYNYDPFNFTNERGHTLLLRAAVKMDAKLAETLIEEGAYLSIALKETIVRKDLRSFALLLHFLEQIDPKKINYPQEVSVIGASHKIIENLEGIYKRASDSYKKLTLKKEIWNLVCKCPEMETEQRNKFLQSLLDNGLNAQLKTGIIFSQTIQTLLRHTEITSPEGILQFLIDQGANLERETLRRDLYDFNILENPKATNLSRVVFRQNKKILKCLLANLDHLKNIVDVAVDAKQRLLNTAFHASVYYSEDVYAAPPKRHLDLEIVKMMLDAGAETEDYESARGVTFDLLNQAVEYCDLELVKLLLSLNKYIQIIADKLAIPQIQHPLRQAIENLNSEYLARKNIDEERQEEFLVKAKKVLRLFITAGIDLKTFPLDSYLLYYDKAYIYAQNREVSHIVDEIFKEIEREKKHREQIYRIGLQKKNYLDISLDLWS